MNVDDMVAACRANGVRLVRFLFCDNSGIIRGKATSAVRLKGRAESGIGMVVGVQCLNMLDYLQPVEGMGATGEVRLIPDPQTFRVLPYAPHSAVALCDLVQLDHRPWGACPRSFARRMLAAAADQGFTIQAAFENEFSLVREQGDGYVPIDESHYGSSVGMGAAAEIIDDLVGALDAQGLTVEQYHPELGHGQHEMSITHAPGVTACDNQLLFRETVRNVAQRHGVVASFAPKPFADQAGNGCHIHFSFWDAQGRHSRSYDPDGQLGLSLLARHFVAGVLAHLPALLALTCPSVNSYRRLLPHHWSSAFTCWGAENREASLRVPTTYWGQEEATTNVELKASDASANPYLALGGIVAAGLDGVRRELEPPDPVEVDPGSLSERQREAQGIRRYPTTLGHALDELEADPVLMEALGEDLRRSYLAVKRSEVAAFAEQGADFEMRHHMRAY